MSESVHVLVFVEGDYIDFIGGVYKHEERVKQAVAVLEERELWSGADRSVAYETFDVIRAGPY